MSQRPTMGGWIKLHRRIAETPLFKHNKTAMMVFVHLLIFANEHGRWAGGRFQLADLCKINPSTLYSTLKRLENDKIITLESNNKWTLISICNWSKYQQQININFNNKSTTGQQQINTLIRSKNKNKNIGTFKETKKEFGLGYLKAKKKAEEIKERV